MDKAELITLFWLMKNDCSHLKTISDYVEQFNVVEKQVRGVMEKMNEDRE